MAGDKAAEVTTTSDNVHDIVSVLSSPNRDYLLRNDGNQVSIDSLKGKKLGLYFSASWCGPCHSFTPILAEAYAELRAKGDFEVVFVSSDNDYAEFKEYFSMMPWLAIPFSDSERRSSLDKLFKVDGIPHLVIIDEFGKFTTDTGVDMIREYGADAYPFTSEKIKELEDAEEEEKNNQTINSVLVNSSRDFVISSNGNKVPVYALKGKMVGIYFSVAGENGNLESKLREFYEKLKADGESFEVVMAPLDEDRKSFNQRFKTMPWLSLPVNDRTTRKLIRYFELEAVPTLVIIGADGKTVQTNVADAVEEHGTLGYPFTPEKLAVIAEIDKAREEAQTLESLLVSDGLDHVIGEGGVKVPVGDLVGKNILLYFSAHWCPPCQAFLPKLTEAYTEIKSKDCALELIFISSDHDQSSFDDYFSKMPWLALPFGDPRKELLSRKFKVDGIPFLVAIGPTGKTVTKDAREMITRYGAEAYPFTDDQVNKLDAKYEELVKKWPQAMKLGSHEHELKLSEREVYFCDVCGDEGDQSWSYYCDQCDYDVHPKCAFKEQQEEEVAGAAKEEENKAKPKPKGSACDGDVCYKA